MNNIKSMNDIEIKNNSSVSSTTRTVNNSNCNEEKEKKFNYLYKITNNINGKYYYGVHSTDNLDDSYFGSGKLLKKAIKKYRKENFTKEIIKFFSTSKEALEEERRIVTEDVVNDERSYNLTLGGGYKDDRLSVYDKIEQKNKKVTSEEYRQNIERYIHVSKGIVIAKDKNNNVVITHQGDKRLETKELVGVTANTVPVEIDGKICRIPSDDIRITSGELKPVKINTHIWALDKDGNEILVDFNDPRWKTREIVGIMKGRIRIAKDGKLKTIKKEDFDSYLKEGWKRADKFDTKVPTTAGLYRIYRYNEDGVIERTLISPDKFEEYEKNGWKRGQGKVKPKRKSTKPPKPRQKGIICFVTSPEGKIKHINKKDLDLYLSQGWTKGVPKDLNPAIGKIHIHLRDELGNIIKHKMILKEDLAKYEESGWKIGVGKRKIK